jgi:hypothetical protein
LNAQLNAVMLALSDARVIAPPAIAIVYDPGMVTGVLVHVNVALAFPLPKTTELAAAPLTVRSVAWTELAFAGSLKLTRIENGEYLSSKLLPQAGTMLDTTNAGINQSNLMRHLAFVSTVEEPARRFFGANAFNC